MQYFDNGENEKVLRALIHAELGFDDDDVNNKKTELAVKKVKSLILKEISKQNNAEPTKKITKIFGIENWIQIAALWIIVITSVILLLNQYFKDRYKFQNLRQFQHTSTRPGEKKLLKLYDGTKIWLSPSSSLEYQDQLIGNFREVKLDGEAFFEVAKDKKHPFIIHSGRMQTEVVGTSFNIKSYSNLNIFSVTVVTGIVRVSVLQSFLRKPEEIVLKPKEQAVFNNEQVSLTRKAIPDLQPVINKRDGILTYDGTPVPEVVADLKRYYNTTIELQNKSAGCLCYGQFDTTKPINIVLKQLAAAIGANVKEIDEKYVLEGGCDEH